MKFLTIYIKMILGLMCVLSYFYKNYLFVEYARMGAKIANSSNNVLVNNHGSFSYITKSQNDNLALLFIFSTVMFVVAITIDLLEKYLRSKMNGVGGK